MAAEWAKRCVVKHGQPYRLKGDLPFKEIGQNIYTTGATESDLLQGIDVYAGEKKDFDYGTNSCKYKKICGHYTQVN